MLIQRHSPAMTTAKVRAGIQASCEPAWVLAARFESKGGTAQAQQLPQSALGSKTPLQAMKYGHKLKPELFRKQPYYRPGCDR